MRRIIYLLIVLAIAAGLRFLSGGKEAEKVRPPMLSGPYTAQEMLESASVVVPDHEFVVSLNRGEATFEQGDIRGTITLGDVFATAKTPGGTDFLGYIVMNTGGSGNFRYLVLYSMTKQGLTHHDSALLGDRITVQSIRTVQKPDEEEYQVVVDTMDRKPDEPMSAPSTVERELTYTVSGHRLIPEEE